MITVALVIADLDAGRITRTQATNLLEALGGCPIPMILYCPECAMQHIDAPEGDWNNPPHRSHLCAGCGFIWRPADVATTGVAAISTTGRNDGCPTCGAKTQGYCQCL